MDIKSKQRLALSVYFFIFGVNFASWTSRIPTIKAVYHLNDAELGTILLAMPISSLIGLPFSGWLITKYETRRPMLVAMLLLTLSLSFIGMVNTKFMLVVSMCVFSFCMRILNISINTQSINIQKGYSKKIVGSFHGLWSSGGVVGVLISTIMVAYNISLQTHFVAISITTAIVSITMYRYTLRNDKTETGNKLIVGKPDKFILHLGLLIFFAAICEGGMFDWSGVFFREVVKAKIFTYGYLIFMICMAVSRFYSDILVDKLGMSKTYILSAVVIASGISVSVIFPFFWPSMIGFCMVGFGTSSIFPMTFTLTRHSKKYSPGMAISILATYAIVGVFVGPPLIGYLSHAFGLRMAFITFIIAGLAFIPVSRSFFKSQKLGDFSE